MGSKSRCKIIDIFTDGGVFEDGKYSVSTAIINMNRNRFTQVKYTSYNKTCTFAEIIAVKKALSRLYGAMKQKGISSDDIKINIYSDSAVTVDTLQKMIGYGYLKEDIYAEEIFQEIDSLFIKLNCPIDIYHINSHIAKNKINKYYDRFCEVNSVDIDKSTFKYLREQNFNCDLLVRRTYEDRFLN